MENNRDAIWAYWQIGRSDYDLVDFSVKEYAERLKNEARKGVKDSGNSEKVTM